MAPNSDVCRIARSLFLEVEQRRGTTVRIDRVLRYRVQLDRQKCIDVKFRFVASARSSAPSLSFEAPLRP